MNLVFCQSGHSCSIAFPLACNRFALRGTDERAKRLPLYALEKEESLNS